MSVTRIFEDSDDLYERIIEDTSYTEEEFNTKLHELVEAGFIETVLVDDQYRYGARKGLSWTDFVHIDDPIKKRVLLLVVDNPKTFFVLYNTQKGKMRIASLEIRAWSTATDIKPVAFVFVSNDKTLADQSADGLLKTIGAERCELFTLSSNTKTTAKEIQRIIDAYEHNDYPMPVIAVLANPKQMHKAADLMIHIRNKCRVGSKLRYGAIWDEADETYPQFRDRVFTIGKESICMRNLLVDDACALHRLGFVTATDGDLIESDDYPECANAYQHPIVIDSADIEHYRAIHLPDAVIHNTPHSKVNNNNTYALSIINSKLSHFKTPVKLRDGSNYYRKAIVNSNARAADMTAFAQDMVEHGCYAITFNMMGLKVHKAGQKVKTYKTKNKKFNELLFYVCKMNDLYSAPLFIIGRRKVDRGLGFHYAPRAGRPGPLTFDGPDGVLHTDGKEGLIWTDVILGRIDDKGKAVQKAGRGAGIIGQSLQYHGHVDYWTDAATSTMIKHHNTIVDATNEEVGSNSILQAKKHAEARNPAPPPPPKIPDYNLSESHYDTANMAIAEFKLAHPGEKTPSKYGLYNGNTQIKYRGEFMNIPTEEEARNSTDLGQGANTSPRVMPVRTNSGIKYVVIYKKTQAPVNTIINP